MKASRAATSALAFLAVSAIGADAQVTQGRFHVVVGGGWNAFADASGVEGGPMIDLEANYALTSSLGIGLWTDITFTQSDGNKFPPAEFSFVDSTTITIVDQPLDIWHYGVQAKLRLPGSLSPFLVLGGGGYTVFLDPQQFDDDQRTTGLALRLGAGIDLALDERTGFQISVADVFYPNWRPERLNPVRSQFRNDRFPELNPDPGELDDAVHNFRFNAAITFVPGG